MSPRPRPSWPEGPNRVRDAAGLLLLFPHAGRANIVLTVRAETLGRHGGQVSLPGGVIEHGEAFEQAALREAHEEISLERAAVRVVGKLTPVDIPVSGFRLHPGRSGFSNLFLAGDWTSNVVNAGCVEAAVISGRLAAHAICGRPDYIYGVFGVASAVSAVR